MSARLPVYRDECRFFNGVGLDHDKCCEAGVNYRALVGGPDHGWVRRIPCLEGTKALPRIDPVDCSKRVLMTQEEHAQREKETREIIDEALAKMARGECPHCGKPSEPSKVVGRCRYAACGHRLGQVADGAEVFE